MKNTIISALNFNILKTNLSKIASKEVKIYVFENYFLKKRSCATVTNVRRRFFNILFFCLYYTFYPIHIKFCLKYENQYSFLHRLI